MEAPYQINLYENGKLVSRDYLSEYTSNDGYDKAWERLYNHLAKWFILNAFHASSRAAREAE